MANALRDGWYYPQEETVVGPVSTRDIQQLVAAGQLQATDTIWKKRRQSRDTLFFPAMAADTLDQVPPLLFEDAGG